MGIFKFFERKKSVAHNQLMDLLNLGQVSAEKMSEATYFACMKILSESVGKLSLKLLKSTEDGGVIRCHSHKLYSVVGVRPNKYIPASLFWSSVEMNRNHHGNAYVWIMGYGDKKSLWLLPSEKVQIYIDNKNLWGQRNAIWYIYYDEKSGVKHTISADSILHFRTSTTFDGISGAAVRTILQSTVDGALTSQDMINKAYKNGFNGKAVLQYSGDISDENAKKYAKIMDKNINSSELKSIIPVALGSTITPISTKFADNEVLGLKKFTALQIAAAFGIKPNQINDYEKSSYASAEAQNLAFYVDTLLFILKHYEEEMTSKLLTDFEIESGMHFKFNVATILRADLKTQIESLHKAVQGGIKTPNEARSMLDLNSIEGGDVLICNGNMMPVKMAGEQFKKGG